MITHQLEEGLLRDVGNVSHRDRGLAGMLPAALVWGIGGALIVAGGFGAAGATALAFLVLVLGLAAGVAGMRLAARAAARRRAESAAAARAESLAASRRDVREARRRGDFDRWERR